MLITRKSQITGKTHQQEIPVTSVQIARWESGELIQDVMPELTPEQREFLISGITEEEWQRAFYI
jgi:hypothetical protein